MMRSIDLLVPFAYAPGWHLYRRYAASTSGQVTLTTVPGGELHAPLTVFARLQTSAAAANRFVVLEVRDQDGAVIAQLPSAAVVPASTTAFYSAFRSAAPASLAVSGLHSLALPPLYLPVGYSLVLVVQNAQTGDTLDQLSAIIEVVDVSPLGLKTGRVAFPVERTEEVSP
jgi:hypothetical protein